MGRENARWHFFFCVPEKFLRSAAALRNDRDQLDFNATARVKPLRNLSVLKQHEVMSAAAPAEGKWSYKIQAGDSHFLPKGFGELDAGAVVKQKMHGSYLK